MHISRGAPAAVPTELVAVMTVLDIPLTSLLLPKNIQSTPAPTSAAATGFCRIDSLRSSTKEPTPVVLDVEVRVFILQIPWALAAHRPHLLNCYGRGKRFRFKAGETGKTQRETYDCAHCCSDEVRRDR